MGNLDRVECVCEIQSAIDWVESLYWGLGRYVSEGLSGYNGSVPFPHTNDRFPPALKRGDSYLHSRNGRKTERSFVCQTDP